MIGEGEYTETETALEDLLTLTGAFPVGDAEVKLQVSHYQNGRIAIEGVLAADLRTKAGRIIAYAGERFGVLTVNVPEFELSESQMLIKSFEHDEDFYSAVLEHFSSVFEDTGKSVNASPDVIANVWRIKPYDEWAPNGEGKNDGDGSDV